jgi:hypothetical protein
MLSSGTAPASGMKLSWKLLTAPHDAAVVTTAHRIEAAMPKRVSFPSKLPPAC